MTIKERIKSPTPPFFRKLRNIGLTIIAASAVVIASPVALPAIIIKIAGYAAIAGTVASTISQTATEEGENVSAKKSKTDAGQ